jgi:2-keto-3-deoxy-L-rhamnonate aldolase RhmA
MPKNRLRQRLRDKETTYGLWVTLESPSLTEIAITLGLDWVCIDMEHGHLGYKEVMEHLRAVRGTETSAIVRVPEITQSAIKRTLDIGAHGVIMPLIRSREDVERGMEFAR